MNYHDRPEYSASMLKKYCCGTAVDFWAAYQDPDRMPMVPSDAMRQGSLVDCLITEPEKFSRKYIVAPIVDRRVAPIPAWGGPVGLPWDSPTVALPPYPPGADT